MKSVGESTEHDTSISGKFALLTQCNFFKGGESRSLNMKRQEHVKLMSIIRDIVERNPAVGCQSHPLTKFSHSCIVSFWGLHKTILLV